MEVFGKLKTLYKILIRGNKATSSIYIRHLKKIGVTIGEGCCFHDPASTFVDEDKPYMIEIGDNVHITRNCTIVAHGYDWIVLKNLYDEKYGSAEKVVIGNNCFLGMGTTVLKGVTIGDNVIIGAGSLVTKDIESNCVAVGRPAKKIMSLDDYREKRKSENLQQAALSYLELESKNMLEKCRNWEFTFLYNKKFSQHVFNDFEEFKKYVEEMYKN